MKCQKFLGGVHGYEFSEVLELTWNSTGLSLGGQVDGLSSARHAEEVWGNQGAFGAAPIHKMAGKKIGNFCKRKFEFPNVLGI